MGIRGRRGQRGYCVELCGHTPLPLCPGPGPGQRRERTLTHPVALCAVTCGGSSVITKVLFDRKAERGEAVPAGGQEVGGKAVCPPPNFAVNPALL